MMRLKMNLEEVCMIVDIRWFWFR